MVILVDLGDDEVAPVDKSNRLSLCESLSIGSFNQNSRTIPNLLHPNLGILDRHRNGISSVALQQSYIGEYASVY